MKLRHVLFASDLSEDSQLALAGVLRLVGGGDTDVTVVHVEYTPPGSEPGSHQGTPIGPSAHDAALREARATLERQVADLAPDREVRIEVLTGYDVGRTVAQCAEEWEADLLVVCTHSRKGLKRLVLGSVAEGVLRHSHVPVLCVPLAALERLQSDVRHIVLTTDLSETAATPFEDVARLAQGLGARLTLLHVVEELNAVPHGAPLAPPVPAPDLSERLHKARQGVEAQAQALQGAFEAGQFDVEVAHHEKPAQKIAGFAREHGADLVALATHGRSGISRLALGSVAAEVVRNSELPVLVYPLLSGLRNAADGSESA